MDWLLAVGLLLCRSGFAWQLIRDWRRHGLTHVSWATMCLLTAGSGALALWGVLHANPAVVMLSLAPGVADVCVALVKFRDWLCTRLRIPVGGHHKGRRR